MAYSVFFFCHQDKNISPVAKNKALDSSSFSGGNESIEAFSC